MDFHLKSVGVSSEQEGKEKKKRWIRVRERTRTRILNRTEGRMKLVVAINCSGGGGLFSVSIRENGRRSNTSFIIPLRQWKSLEGDQNPESVILEWTERRSLCSAERNRRKEKVCSRCNGRTRWLRRSTCGFCAWTCWISIPKCGEYFSTCCGCATPFTFVESRSLEGYS